MKNFTLRIPDEMHGEIQKMSEGINCSTHAMIMFLIKLGLKVYGADTTIRLAVQKPQLAHASSHESESPQAS